MIVLTCIDKKILPTATFIEVSTQGHSFITFIVAFLLISRVATGLARYNTARDCLGTMYRESRELIQHTCVFSSGDTSAKAAQWRHDVAYRCLILLHSVMAVIDFSTDGVPAWEVPELNGKEKQYVMNTLYADNNSIQSNRRWAHHGQAASDWEESMRVPIRLEYLLCTAIHAQAKTLTEDLGLFENKLLGSVGSFMVGYDGMRKFLTTVTSSSSCVSLFARLLSHSYSSQPVPFPLIQMARTFLFLYVFTVPFVLLKDQSPLFAHCFSVFLLTYGFVGLELVAIELDDPFGNDANDLDNGALAMTAYEDIYLTVLDLDGPEWTDKLRVRMHNPSVVTKVPLEQEWLVEAVRDIM